MSKRIQTMEQLLVEKARIKTEICYHEKILTIRKEQAVKSIEAPERWIKMAIDSKLPALKRAVETVSQASALITGILNFIVSIRKKR